MAEPGTPRDDVDRLRGENARLRAELERSQRELDRVTRERERLRRENERLKDELETARRAAKRRSRKRPLVHAPSARDANPGVRMARRDPPTAAPHRRNDHGVLAACPHCRGPVQATRTSHQLQVDVPVVRPIVRTFQIAIGRCRRCGRRVQGRHALQTSDALGAAAHHLGPQTLALTATLHTALGVPYAKIARLFTTAFGLTVHRRTLCRALTRVATRAVPTCTALADHVRRSPVVSMDETGWKVAAQLEWLWAAVTPDTTVYRIQPGRSFPLAATLIGADYDGVLVRDS